MGTGRLLPCSASQILLSARKQGLSAASFSFFFFSKRSQKSGFESVRNHSVGQTPPSPGAWWAPAFALPARDRKRGRSPPRFRRGAAGWPSLPATPPAPASAPVLAAGPAAGTFSTEWKCQDGSPAGRPGVGGAREPGSRAAAVGSAEDRRRTPPRTANFSLLQPWEHWHRECSMEIKWVRKWSQTRFRRKANILDEVKKKKWSQGFISAKFWTSSEARKGPSLLSLILEWV